MATTLNNDEFVPSFQEQFRKVAEKHEAPNETWSHYIGRNLGQYGARAAETVGGFPGALKNQVQTSRKFLEDFLGLPSLQEEEEKAFGKQEEKSLSERSISDLVFNPPTPGELRETVTPKIAEVLTGKKEGLEPKSEGERFFGDLTQDLTSFFLPGTGGLSMMVRIGAPVLGNLLKEGLEYVGTSKETAEKAKIGSMIAFTVANQSQPQQFSSQRIGEAKNMIPNTATVAAAPLLTRLLTLRQRLAQGLDVPSKTRTLQGTTDLINQFRNGRLNFRSLMEARDNINEWISEAGGWDVPVNTRDASIRNLNALKRDIIETTQNNLDARFPQVAELYRTGYEAAAVTHQSNAISNFIERNFGRKTASIGAKILFPSIATGSVFFVPKAAASGAALYPLYKTGQVLYRVSQSPTLAQYYQNVLVESMRGNVPAMVNNLTKLDKELAKQEKKDSKTKKQSLQDFHQRFLPKEK